MSKQALRHFIKRQKYACRLLNSIPDMAQSLATGYTGRILFDSGITPEALEEIIKELESYHVRGDYL